MRCLGMRKRAKEQTLNVSRILGLSTSFEVENSAQDEIVCSKSTTCTSTNVVENENVISTTVSGERVCNGMNFQSPYFVNCDLNIVVNKV